MLTLDGSQGEGGGQILRAALTLAMVTRRPFRIFNIRARRSRPGLLPQHLTAVLAAQAISGGEVRGAEIGSRELTFWPGALRSGTYHFVVGTAGSTLLVVQTILPALALAPGPSVVTLEGGTHTPNSPPFEYFERVFLPLFNRMGPRVTARLERHGFYPAGGGQIHVAVEPVATLGRLDLRERGAVHTTTGTVLTTALPASVGERELAVLAARLGWPARCFRPESVLHGHGPGYVVATEIQCEHVTERFTACGGLRGEDLAAGVAAETLAYMAAGVPVGHHLADQLLVPMALAGEGVLRTVAPTPHTLSQIAVLERFLGLAVHVIACGEGAWEIAVIR